MSLNNHLNLGPIVGRLAGTDVYANQLQRKNASWGGGKYTPSDGQDTNLDHAPIRKLTATAKSLVIYWSRSGSTELLASKIVAATTSDVLEVTVAQPYPADYLQTLDRANEERERQTPPQLNLSLPDLSQYETIFLGFQTWAMTLSQPMKAFLLDFGGALSGKRIAPFETEGGYGSGESIQVIHNILKEISGDQVSLTEPLVIDGNRVDEADARVTQWLARIGA